MGLEPTRNHGDGLADVIDAVLDKGLVINADIMVSLAGVELLGIKIRAALASFETAARYGLEFPSGTNLQAPGWRAVGPAQAQAQVQVQAHGDGYGETFARHLAAEAPEHVPAR